MPLYAVENNKEDYQLFLDFKESFLVNGYSYFDKSLKVITQENLDEFEKRFIENYIAGSEQDFNEKATEQLESSSKSFKHLFSNYIWLYNFFFSSVDGGSYKVSKSVSAKHNEVNSYLGEHIEIDFIPEYGFANCGTSYNTRKDVEICYIHIFVREIFKKPALLTQEENLTYFIKNMNVKKQIKNYVGTNLFKSGIKNILLFLLMPNRFEPIVSYGDKESIVNGFGIVDAEKDVDENLLLIREKFDIDKSFYEDEYISIWENAKAPKNPKNKSIKKARVIPTSKGQGVNKKIKVKSNNDLHEEYDNKLKAGQNAEEAVFYDVQQKFMSKKKDIEYINAIFKKLSSIYPFEDVKHLTRSPLKEISMFSQYVYTNAPFDIIYPCGSDIKYVEVKNCSSTPCKIYMSVGELNFAYKNSDNYELKIVVDGEILDVEDLPIEELYNQVKEINSTDSILSISNFELSLEII